jgi:hypothetical protein
VGWPDASTVERKNMSRDSMNAAAPVSISSPTSSWSIRSAIRRLSKWSCSARCSGVNSIYRR